MKEMIEYETEDFKMLQDNLMKEVAGFISEIYKLKSLIKDDYIDACSRNFLELSILHILTANNVWYYDKKNLFGIYQILNEVNENEKCKVIEYEGGDLPVYGFSFFEEIKNTSHFFDGKKAEWLETALKMRATSFMRKKSADVKEIFNDALGVLATTLKAMTELYRN